MGMLRFRAKSVNEGQTAIETVVVLVILLILFFFIVEFARAWYLKNSLNNAVRVAVRQAVVTPNLTGTAGSEQCSSPSHEIVIEVCSSPGVPGGVPDNDTEVWVVLTDDSAPAGFGPGDTVTVNAKADFYTLAPPLGGILPDFVTAGASMRYE